jgi:hypothetical protein
MDPATIPASIMSAELTRIAQIRKYIAEQSPKPENFPRPPVLDDPDDFIKDRFGGVFGRHGFKKNSWFLGACGRR